MILGFYAITRNHCFFLKKNILFENENKNQLGKVFFSLKSNIVTKTDFLQFGQCTLVSF